MTIGKDYVISNSGVVKTVVRDEAHPYGVMDVDKITPGVPAILLFGGEYSHMKQSANHYIKNIKTVLNQANVDIPDIYSAYYEFGSWYPNIERRELFRAAGRKLTEKIHPNAVEFRKKKLARMNENEPTPAYIANLYNILIRPLMVDDNGNARSLAEIKQNMRMIRVYAYSHGAAVVYRLGQMAKQELKSMNLKTAEIQNILNNIVVIQFGPVAPLENPNFTTISFISGNDTMSDGHNNFSDYMYDNAENLYPAYFPQNGAHVFIAGKISDRFDGDGNSREHDDSGLVQTDHLTDDGVILFNAARNALANAVKSATDGNISVNIPDLVAGDGVDFQEMEQNGKLFYEKMLNRLRAQKQIPVPDYQK